MLEVSTTSLGISSIDMRHVLDNALGDMYVYDSLRTVEKVKSMLKYHVNRFRHNINNCWKNKK